MKEQYEKVIAHLQKDKESLNARLAYYENPNSPPSKRSLQDSKKKKIKNEEEGAKEHKKPGQKLGHQGVSCKRDPDKVYAQVQGILTSMQAQLHLIDPYARHELNLDLRIYQTRQ